MVVTVASGKGGTGKTTVAVNLAYALAGRGRKVRLLDCDVEEPNDHLFVGPDFVQRKEVNVLKPVLDAGTCTGCGACAEACNYNAIAVVKGNVLLFNELCHSCGVCSYVCPENALHEEQSAIGIVEQTRPDDEVFFAHGKLNIGETLAPSVVEAVKELVQPEAVNIIDASPGTACPVVKALEGADVAVLVTEPTPFGLNDLKLAAAMTVKMGIPTGIVVNRSGGEDRIIQQYCAETGIEILGRIPFKRAYAETYSDGEILVKHHDEVAGNLLEIFDRVEALRGTSVPAVPAVEEFTADSGTEKMPEKAGPGARDEIVVISGKGGTGKTTLTACFAQLFENHVLADNDVDAADMHLLFSPTVREVHPFVGGYKAAVNSSRCIACGKCAEACHFDAIRCDGPGNGMVGTTYRIEDVACEGCGLCPRVCPVGAISAEKAVTGNWYDSWSVCGPMAHARLGIAEENSGRLVTQVRSHAAEQARRHGMETILGDGPPGTGCPVIASVSGTDLVIIVTEPTVSGVHDMERVLDLASHFGIRSLVIVNKADLNRKQAARIETIAAASGSRVIGEIPFDPAVNDSLMAGKTVLDYGAGPAAEAVEAAWRELKKELRHRKDGSRTEKSTPAASE